MKSVHVKIYGRVQGVWFRASTKQKADELGLKGWVRNTSDGCVEAVFFGKEPIVNEILNWCKKGPKLSRVEKVEIIEEKTSCNFQDFIIKY